MGYGNSQVKMNLDRMKIAMETCEATATVLETAVEDVRTTMTDLEYCYIGEDANTLQNEMKNYLDNQVEDIRLNAESMKKALEQGLENARYCKNYCQHFVDALGGGANEAANDNEEIPGAMFCDYDAVEGLMELCTEAERLGEEIRQSTYKIENVLNLEVVSFDVTYYTSAVRAECDKIDRLEVHKRNLENYASFVETTDTELASSLRGIHDIFRDQEGAEIGNLEYGSIDAEIKKMQKMEKIREELIKQYGEDIVDEWGELTLIEMQKNMRSLPVKYTDEEMINILEMCQTKEDQAFIKLLLQGEYDEAFALAPNELSLEISYVLADYSAHLIRYDGKGRYEEGERNFTDFNNAMLASDRYICYMQNGTWVQEERQYRDAYQDMLIQGSAFLLQEESFRLSLMNPYGEDYDKSYYTSCYSSHAIWCTQDDVISMLHNRGEDINYKFEGLKFNKDRTIQFSINHHSPMYGTEKDEIVTIRRIVTGEDVQLVNDQLEFKKAREERERLISNFFYNLCKDSSLSALSVCDPMAAVTLSLISMAFEQSAGTISGASAFIDGNLQKTAFGVGNAVVKNTINTIADLQAASGKMDAINREKLMEMVGSGAYFKIEEGGVLEPSDYNYAFVGIYDPDMLRALDYWTTYGAAGWSEYSEEEIASMITEIEDLEENAKSEKEKEKYELCKRMLEGGTIFSEESCNMEQFNDAITEITDRGTSEKSDGEEEKSKTNLDMQFKNFAWDKRGVGEKSPWIQERKE